jgi:hypothetical protein
MKTIPARPAALLSHIDTTTRTLYKMGREVTTTLPPFPAGKQGGMRLPLRLARRRVAPSRKGTGRLGGVPRRAGRLTP